MDLIERFKTLCDLQAYPSYSQLDSVKCHRYAPPVHMIRLSEEREITPSVWVHLDEER